MSKITVLLTGVEGQHSLSTLKCLRKAGGYRIITVGIDDLCMGLHCGDENYRLHKGHWNRYSETIEEICNKEGVDIIIPNSDVELTHFAENRKFYELNCPPVLIDWENVFSARDKLLTSVRLEEVNLPYTKTWNLRDYVTDKVDFEAEFPVVIKPRFGYGSKYTFKNVYEDELPSILKHCVRAGWEPIIQEQLKGDEFSCMTFRAKDGELLATSVAWCVKKFGMSYKYYQFKNEDSEIEKSCQLIAEKLDSIGPLSIQMIGKKVFEINARFTGAQIARAYAGINGPDLLIKNWLYGTKKYPKIKKDMECYWYADYAYNEGGKLSCPKYL